MGASHGTSAQWAGRLVAFDWNCSQHITARFTEGEIAEAMQPLRDRLVALEAENASLRAKLDSGPASRV
jgi:hypothetical protein